MKMTREEAIEKIKDVINKYVGFIRNRDNVYIIVEKKDGYTTFIVMYLQAILFEVSVFLKTIIIEHCNFGSKKELSVLYSMWEEIENILDKVVE